MTTGNSGKVPATPPVKVVIPNNRGVRCNAITLTAKNPKQQLPGLAIPDGRALVIRSNPLNPALSVVLVDGISPSGTSWPLSRGESVSYHVKNASALWVGTDGALLPLTVNYTVEVDT